MAGKHPGVTPTYGGTAPPTYPGSRDDKAYAEGMEASYTGATNPHTAGTPEYIAFENGTAGDQGSTSRVGGAGDALVRR